MVTIYYRTKQDSPILLWGQSCSFQTPLRVNKRQSKLNWGKYIFARPQVQKIKNLKRTEFASKNERILGAYPEYWLNLKGYDPAKTADSIKRPLLIMQGGRDYQVTNKDFMNWKKSLGSKENVTFKFYPSLNHLFIPGKGPSYPSEYQKSGHVDENVIQDIAFWIRM